MSKSQSFVKFLFLGLLFSLLVSACYGSRGTAPDQNLPGDPHLIVETFTPTPDPLIAGTLTIVREGKVSAGDGATFNVSGILPLQLLYRESAFTGDDLIETQGPGTGFTTMYGHGTVGTSNVTGIWEVTLKVRGILHPAPKCDVELWIEEYWGDNVTLTMTVNGEVVTTTMATIDLIPFLSGDHGSGHIIIPKSQTELVEIVSSPDIDWFNTYTIELQPLTKFEGCNN